MLTSSSTGTVGRFRNATHDGLRKTHAWIASRPQDAIVARDPTRGRGGGSLRDRQSAASDAAAMGGADLAHRDPDERRPLAEGDPGLHAWHGRGRGLWRRHRDVDPAFRRRRIAGAAGADRGAAMAFIGAINPSL